MQRNRVLLGVCLVAAALTVSACSSGGSGGSDSKSGGGAKGGYNITLIPGVSNDAYYGSVACGVKTVAQKDKSSVDVQAPKTFSPTDQIPLLRAAIARKPDAIIIAPTDSKSLYAPLLQAKQAGIKIVLVDTTLDNPSVAESQVSSDNIKAGQTAAQTLAKLIGNKKGSVLTVNLTAGVTTTDQRAEGFADVIKKTSGLSYLGQQYSDNSVQKASQIVSSTLASHSDLVGIFSTAAFNTEGAVAALRQSGKKGIEIVGFDANPPGVKQIEDGTVAAQVVLKPYDEGRFAAEQAINALEGKKVTPKISTGALVATKANLKSPEVQKYLYSFTCPSS